MMKAHIGSVDGKPSVVFLSGIEVIVKEHFDMWLGQGLSRDDAMETLRRSREFPRIQVRFLEWLMAS